MVDENGVRGETDSTRHYVISRQTPGSTIHASATVQTAGGATEFLEVSVKTPDGEECDSATGLNQLRNGQLLSAGVTVGVVGVFGDIEQDTPCMKSDTLLYSVEDRPTEPVDTARPVEIRVIEESPVKDAASLPTPAVNPTWTKPKVGPATDVTGGASFKDAPLLEPGTYGDTLVPGEVLTYQIELEWGEQLSALIKFPMAGEKLGNALGRSDIISELQIYGPGRADVTGSGETDGAFLPTTYLAPEPELAIKPQRLRLASLSSSSVALAATSRILATRARWRRSLSIHSW